MSNKLVMVGLMCAALGGFLPGAYADENMGEAVTSSVPEGTPPSATLEVEATQLRLLIGGAKGSGVLHYQGKDYPFKVSGAAVGGVGYAKTKATGEVYLMNKLEDFPGKYSAATVGAAAGKGVGASTYTNASSKVELRLKSESEGLGLFLGLGAIEIELDQ